MSLVILNDTIADQLKPLILEKLIQKLRHEIELNNLGNPRGKQIDALCTEISNIARQTEPVKPNVFEVKF